jgi:hypothetical protein
MVPAPGDGAVADLHAGEGDLKGADLSVTPVDLPPPPPNAFDLGPLNCTGNETFTAAQQAMLSSCGAVGSLGCHGRAPFSGRLDLTTANAYSSLVNVASDIAPNKLRVKPGDPNNSFLVEKLTNTQGAYEGDPMPQTDTGQWLVPAQDKLNVLRCWIQRGAPNN